MSVNSALKFLTAFLFMLMPACVFAQGGSAPAMFDVREVVIQFTSFGDPETANSCGLSREELASMLNKTLQDNGVPAIPVTEANPPVIGTARIELLPEIFSFNSQGLDCTSWVSLTAQSRNSLHIPPVNISRNVTVTYWRQGLLLSSSQATHEHIVSDALQKLTLQFARQYRLDQPAVAPKP